MTTNKPEVVAYHHINKANPGHRGVSLHHDASCTSTLINTEPLIRLSDYEALQAECENLRKHLQNLIDQTTPLEPVPGNPMWSRRIQLDVVMAERDRLRVECEKLRSIISDLKDWDCDVSAGFLSIPLDLRRRMKEAIDTAMEGGKP